MEFDMRTMKVAIDYSTPFKEFDYSGGLAPLTAGTSRPPTSSSESPQASYNLLNVPISTSKAVRIGCWSTSPVDSDALNGIIYPNFLQTFGPSKECPSEIPVADVNVSGTVSPTLPVRISENIYSLGPVREDTSQTEVYKGSDVNQPLKYDPSPDCPPSVEFPAGSLYCADRRDRTWIVDALKENLKLYEIMFKSQYCYDTTTMEVRDLVRPLSSASWTEKSSGIPWFGVYGIDEICVVTLGGHLDRKRVLGCLASQDPKAVLSIFRKCVLSELEDLADPSSKRCKELGQSFDTPFCVVSATPGTAKTLEESVPETSIVGYVSEALFCVHGSHLLRQDQDKGDAIKLAIFGFQHMFGKRFEAEEIGVTVMFGRNFGTGYMRDLDISEIGDYLSAVEALGNYQQSSIEHVINKLQ